MGGNSSAAAPSFKQAPLPPRPLPQQPVPASLGPCLPCYKHSPPEDTVFRGTRFHHISAPMPRPHSPAASSQTAQHGAMADTQGINFSPAALLKEKKLVSMTDRKGARTETQAAQDTGQTSRGALGSPPCSLFFFFGADLAPATGLCPPPRALGGLPEEQGEELSKH